VALLALVILLALLESARVQPELAAEDHLWVGLRMEEDHRHPEDQQEEVQEEHRRHKEEDSALGPEEEDSAVGPELRTGADSRRPPVEGKLVGLDKVFCRTSSPMRN